MIEAKKQFIEKFFITMVESKFCGKTSYLEMPDNNSFKYCLKEVIYCLLKKDSSDKNIRDYTIQSYQNFYKYIQDDIIFQKVNDFEYKNLVLKLKELSEGSEKMSTSSQLLSYFQMINNKYSKKYKDQCFLFFIDMYTSNNKIIEDTLYKISNIFLNELLAFKMNYKFIEYSLSLYKLNKFSNFIDYIKYLHYANTDYMEIYLPIKNYNDQDLKFIKTNAQEISTIKEIKYCKTYGTRIIDFYSWVNKQTIRIEAIFNTLRFYTKSEIDFDFNKNIIIHSSLFKEDLLVGFLNVVSYSNKFLNFNNLNKLLISLNKLKGDEEKEEDCEEDFEQKCGINIAKYKKKSYIQTTENKILYFKILNILSFVEKDKDLLNYNAFMDNWTALETLCGLSKIKHGYESVNFFVPKIITPKIILNDINDVFFRNNNNKIRFNVENFIENSKADLFDFTSLNNPYYEYKMKNYKQIFSSLTNFYKYLQQVESLISYDIMRIYIVRNEYAHESNLNAFNSMQQYRLKTILPFLIDEFFKIMNMHIDRFNKKDGLAFEVFNDFFLRYENKKNAQILIDKGIKIKNGGINIKMDFSDVTESEFMFNILKNNAYIFKKYTNKNSN